MICRFDIVIYRYRLGNIHKLRCKYLYKQNKKCRVFDSALGLVEMVGNSTTLNIGQKPSKMPIFGGVLGGFCCLGTKWVQTFLNQHFRCLGKHLDELVVIIGKSV